MKHKNPEHKIKSVAAGSIAQELGLEKGDVLLQINGEAVEDVFDYHYGSGHVYNLGTQESWKTSAKLEYIAIAIDRMLELAERCQVPAIALPAIGAGLGGLKWHDVKAVIKNAAKLHPEVTLYVVESYRP